MLSRWLPWKWLLRRAARRHGFMDPFTVLARIRRFSQPSEVAEPMELIRAGAVFHARGLVNTKAIQHNLDWLWPYWVNRQFNPGDSGFVPRAFSFSHVNLTHRNWTAVGLPYTGQYAVVDPRGLVTPLPEGWSLDCWLMPEAGEPLLPARALEAEQSMAEVENPTVETCTEGGAGKVKTRCSMEIDGDHPVVRMTVTVTGRPGDHLVVAVRPYNPEGVQFVDRIRVDGKTVRVESEQERALELSEEPESVVLSHYEEGDVWHRSHGDDRKEIRCPVGLATVALRYVLGGTGERTITVTVPRESVTQAQRRESRRWGSATAAWEGMRESLPVLEIPDKALERLTRHAMRTLLLLSGEEVVPGPYTYNRFWFRDAVLMLNGVLSMGQVERTREHLERFGKRQRVDGYFHSQTGEWDSNGQVLWLMGHYEEMSGNKLTSGQLDQAEKAVKWIGRKRRSGKRPGNAAGLLPAGFSAEHFGPNDYYYWDDYWALAGLRAASRFLRQAGRETAGERAAAEAEALSKDLEASVAKAVERNAGAIPAAPGRRMDAGAIGSMVADYPLQLYKAEDARCGGTLEWLLENCLYHGGFFQDMIHSGINAYLTLDLAQSLLRRGDARYRDLVDAVARLASPCGDWPEAIHPRTFGGCMGDGQHGWAAVEWFLMVRALFVREEDGDLIIGSGLYPEWLRDGHRCFFGPTLTRFGAISVEVVSEGNDVAVLVDGTLRRKPGRIRLAPPGFQPREITQLHQTVRLQRA